MELARTLLAIIFLLFMFLSVTSFVVTLVCAVAEDYAKAFWGLVLFIIFVCLASALAFIDNKISEALTIMEGTRL